MNKLNELFDAIESEDRAMGSLSIYHDGREIYQRSIGFENKEKGIKATIRTRYRIGSITKSFMAAIIMQMVEEGKLTLDTKLSEYYPQFQNADDISIEHLLRHRSGLFNFTDAPSYPSYMQLPQSHEQLLERMMLNENTFMPDEKMEYSNTGYILLCFIAEIEDCKTFDQLLKDRITSPQNLADTYVGGKIGNRKNEALSYHLGDGWVEASETDMSIPGGAGAIASTPGDINKFYQALFSGQIVSPPSVDLMTSMQDDYGFGLTEFPFYRKKAIGHDGSIDGFRSIAGQFITDDVAVCYISNGTEFLFNDILIGVLSIYFGIEYDIPSFRLMDVPEQLSVQYVGMYGSSTHELDIEITRVGRSLTAQASGQNAFPLKAMGDHLFTFDPADITMKFDIEAGTMKFCQAGSEHVFKVSG